MYALVLALASSLASTPIGIALFGAAVCLSYANGRLALIFLFASGFLPFLWGAPALQGYLAVLALFPVVLFDFRRAVSLLPQAFVLLVLSIGCLIFITYPIHKAIDLQMLGFSMLAAVTSCYLVRKWQMDCRTVLRDVLASVSVALLIPLLTNSVAVIYSPFWQDRHIGYFAIGRFSVAFVEPNSVGAYLTAAFVIGLCLYRFRGFAQLAMFSAFSVALLYGTNLTGSRTALVFAVVALTIAIIASIASSGRRTSSGFVSWPSVRVLSLSVISVALLAGIGYIVVTGALPGGVERLAGTAAIEDTGRPKSFRDAAPFFDSIPLAGQNLPEYVLHSAPHTPHFSPLAALLFLGLPIALLLYALIATPILDLITGSKIGAAPVLATMIASLFVIMLPLPVTSDRGTLVLVGVWFALSRLPGFAFRGAETNRAPSLSA